MRTIQAASKRVLMAIAAVSLFLGYSSSALAASAEVEDNKAVVQHYLEAMGTAEFAAVADATLAANHKLLRHEFENLRYNADEWLTHNKTN